MYGWMLLLLRASDPHASLSWMTRVEARSVFLLVIFDARFPLRLGHLIA
jgi:hypothetical protein